jgi:hypothetical protein
LFHDLDCGERGEFLARDKPDIESARIAFPSQACGGHATTWKANARGIRKSKGRV